MSLLALATDLPVANSLIDMYAQCGYLGEAQAVFGNMSVRDEVLWTTLIAGYAEEGLGEKALEHLKQMQLEGFIPNAVKKLVLVLERLTKGNKYMLGL